MMKSKLVKVSIALLILVSIMIPAHARYETGGTRKTILSNGMTILVRPEPESKVVAIEIFIRIDAADENPVETGIGHLLAGTILAGTEHYSTTKLARLVSEVGGNFHALWQWNYLEVYAVTIPEMCGDVIGLLSDSVQESRLDSRAVEYSKSAILREVQRQQNDPFNLAYTALRQSIHRGTPYARPFIGDPEKLESITAAQLKRFYQRTFSPEKIVISVVGNVNPEYIARKIETNFMNMPRKGPRPEDITPENRRSEEELSIRYSGPVTYEMIGYSAPGVSDPDYPAMCVANVLLGGNKSSLLFTKLREEKGLGYHVGSLYPALRGVSHVAAFMGIDSTRATSETLQEVREIMAAQVEILKSGGFTDDDLERAKGYLIGRHALRHERTRDRAFLLGWHEAIGLGYQYDFLYADKMSKVTRDDVIRVCGKYLRNPVKLTLHGTGSGT